VLGETGRNFAAGMSGGVAYVYDVHGRFGALANLAMVDLERIGPAASNAQSGDETRRPRQRALGTHDSGMGDMLSFDAERLRILVERHFLHTKSERARLILEHWHVALAHFVKVMPKDYRAALLDLQAERRADKTVAAE
jgi:glutamate synthase (NADPH/NADH) large chain